MQYNLACSSQLEDVDDADDENDADNDDYNDETMIVSGHGFCGAT